MNDLLGLYCLFCILSLDFSTFFSKLCCAIILIFKINLVSFDVYGYLLEWLLSTVSWSVADMKWKLDREQGSQIDAAFMLII